MRPPPSSLSSRTVEERRFESERPLPRAQVVSKSVSPGATLGRRRDVNNSAGRDDWRLPGRDSSARVPKVFPFSLIYLRLLVFVPPSKFEQFSEFERRDGATRCNLLERALSYSFCLARSDLSNAKTTSTSYRNVRRSEFAFLTLRELNNRPGASSLSIAGINIIERAT